jgi:hypothetical protein
VNESLRVARDDDREESGEVPHTVEAGAVLFTLDARADQAVAWRVSGE